VFSILIGALLFELHASPMPFIHGDRFSGGVTQALKTMPMRGGVLELPSMPQPPFYSWHLSMLRSVDHGHPVIFAASSFTPYLTMKIHGLASGPTLSQEFLDLIEEVPVSYIVVRTQLFTSEQQPVFQKFLSEARESGRLKLVGSYDKDELYAVTKTEPEVR
jgi:hypothetical protein